MRSMGMIMPVIHSSEPYGAEERVSVKLKEWVAVLALNNILS